MQTPRVEKLRNVKISRKHSGGREKVNIFQTLTMTMTMITRRNLLNIYIILLLLLAIAKIIADLFKI